MDKQLAPKQTIEQRPIDDLDSLDGAFDDLMASAHYAESQIQRFALCVDATSSMGHVWSRAKTALKTAVDHISSNATCPILIKVVAYRDHEYDGPLVVQQSGWSADTNYLKDYIANMKCHGGGDYPESVGHGLAALLKDQQTPNQIILIGDAPGKATSLGYAEAKACGQQECPIYALHTNDDPLLVAAFTEIARLSGGKAFLLSPDANLNDIFKVLMASNKKLQITYQATSIEGRKLTEKLKG